MAEPIDALSCGLSAESPCHYLPGRQEQMLVIAESRPLTPQQHESLLALGFRRSGGQVYRPWCARCQACQPLRLPVDRFRPSASQKRLLNKAQDLHWRLSCAPDARHYPLFARYIEARHRDGSMYPPSEQQYREFLLRASSHPRLLEIFGGDQLLAVAVTDCLPHCLSAVYTFFDPDETALSLGTLAVLYQVELAQALDKAWLYLGYQIDACAKMNYKTRFRPFQRLVGVDWIET